MIRVSYNSACLDWRLGLGTWASTDVRQRMRMVPGLQQTLSKTCSSSTTPNRGRYSGCMHHQHDEAQPPLSIVHHMASTWAYAQLVRIRAPLFRLIYSPHQRLTISDLNQWLSTLEARHAMAMLCDRMCCRISTSGASEASFRASRGKTRPGRSERMKL